MDNIEKVCKNCYFSQSRTIYIKYPHISRVGTVCKCVDSGYYQHEVDEDFLCDIKIWIDKQLRTVDEFTSRIEEVN